MVYLEAVQYGKLVYPNDIHVEFQEISATYNANPALPKDSRYCLHTEPSQDYREFGNVSLANYPRLCNSRKQITRDGRPSFVPFLWESEEWSRDFACMIVEMVGCAAPPGYIEIHPPFRSVCSEISTFVSRYKVFEEEILSRFPDTSILIENRSTSPGGKDFILREATDFAVLVSEIERHSCELKLVIDIPQLVTAECRATRQPSVIRNEAHVRQILAAFAAPEYVAGLHVCGRAHHGTLDSLFADGVELAEALLTGIHDALLRGQSCLFVPEINSGAKGQGMTRDDVLTDFVGRFQNAGFVFIESCQVV